MPRGLGVAGRDVPVIGMVAFVPVGTAAHHLEHRGAPGTEEPDQQRSGQQQEDDVEDRGVVPG